MRFPLRALACVSLLVLAAARGSAAEEAPAAPPGRPNVILIVADDLGYGETGAQGSRDVPTPHIDSLARNGIRITQGYVTCPVCAPTRAGLLTGRYGERFGFDRNPGPEASAPEQYGLPKDQPTLAERLRAAGYATGMFGKWHLGYREGLRPAERGFDEFLGFLGGAHPYLPGGKGARGGIFRGATEVDAPPYLTDALGEEAAAFVARNKDRPFLLYLPFNAVHSPLQATEKYLARFDASMPERRRTFAAMLSAMDDAIGRVLVAVREAGLEERTLIVFLSDNGGPTRQTTSGNGPLRGYKGQVLEGGIRVPFLVQWKGRLPAGVTYDAPVLSLDVVPTALAAAGAPAGPEARLDGANLLPFLEGKATGRPHVALCWRYGSQSAVRVGDWKLVIGETDAPALYDLSKDLGEANDLAAANPDRVVTLEAVWAAWNASNEEPRWGGGAGRRGGGAKEGGRRGDGAGMGGRAAMGEDAD